MDLQFNELLTLIVLAWGIVQSALLYRAIPRGAWDKFIDQFNADAIKTENKLDDAIGAAVKNQLTPLLERFGLFKDDNIFTDIEDKNENNPPVTLPPSQPSEPVGYSFGLTSYATRKDFPPDRQVHVPERATYVPHKESYPQPNVNIDLARGTEFNIFAIAGDFGYTFDPVRLESGVSYEVSLTYFAEISGKEPLNEWIWLRLLDNGTDVEQVHGIEKGTHSAVWVLEGDGKTHSFTPLNNILWANGGDDSVIQWHKLTVTPVEKKA